MDTWVPSDLPFDNQPGPNHSVVSEDPVDFIDIFISDEVIDLLVLETNRYAEDSIQKQRDAGRQKRRSRSLKWKPVDAEEMRRFLGLMFLTGMIHKPTLEQYWSTDPMLATPYFAATMTRDR
jgi:hypothetical protein